MGNKEKIEALLFSSGKKMSVDELMKLCRLKEEDVLSALKELRDDFERKGGSFKLVEDGRDWRFVVKEEFLPLVSKIVTETELPKTVLETLAVIAFRYPIKQSDLIHMRTNKAYDHLALLENSGYITRVKYGRTKLIKLTQKFFEYFDLPPEKLKEKFESFESIARAIEQKESDIKTMKEEQKRKAEDAGKAAKEVDLVDEEGHKVKLAEYESTGVEVEKEEEKSEVEIFEEPSEEEAPEKELEVYERKEEPKEKVPAEEGEAEEKPEEEKEKGEAEHEEGEEEPEEKEAEEEKEEEPEEEAEEEKEKPKKKTSEEEAVDKRVEEMLHPKKEEGE
ncbi:MAG TPA: SMC-Scp complex subunit ScpB [Candidatus Nanoarchaeia archaeon]|nr:SMC-Scp complex subunit ScpB [Candidatus Nanoarchaeia archaeon]